MGKTTAADRLIFTLLFSVILHLVVILGVSFTVSSPPTNTPYNNLDITLVKEQTDTKPEKADYLAQVNNLGGGETDKKSRNPTPDKPVPIAKKRPSSPPPQPLAMNTPEIQPAPIPAPAPQPKVEPRPVPKKKVEPPKKVKPTPAKPKPQPKKSAKVLTQKKAERKVHVKDEHGTQVKPKVEKTAEPTPQISARDLIMSAQNEIDQLENHLDATTKALSERPRRRFISASTKQYAAAAYMRAWELKVERIGNMNYPEEAKEKNINGSLMLSVDINPDGSVPANGIVVSRSSGYKVLDDAAIKIVRLGAPYAPIPKNVLEGNDMLTIIRTWKFETDEGLSAR